LEVMLKLLALAPVIVVALMIVGLLPLLVAVSNMAAVDPERICPAASDVGENEICGPVPTPVPASVTICGELVALSTRLIWARKLDAVGGVKVTAIAQVLLATTVVQVF
jgi:hypothetical protein